MLIGLALLLGASRGPALFGQDSAQLNHEVFAGSEAEEYLRALQVVGQVPLRIWSLRAFSPAEVDALIPDSADHPWSARLPRSDTAKSGLRVRTVLPRLHSTYNSALPYGFNDGPVWAGRGMTTSLQGGVSARYRGISLVLAPVLFRAENAEFDLKDGFKTDQFSEFVDPIYPIYIDLPQRFGTDAYTRLDPGESTLRVDGRGLTAGVSTASGFWGPASDLPLILGNNAGGFPHVFLGSLSPRDLWIGKLHGRIVWGRLDQSEHSPMPDSTGRRFATGMVLSFTPRGLPGLEVGAARFFHNIWPTDGLRLQDFGQPFQEMLKSRLPVQAGQDTVQNDDLRKWSPDNQLASVYARWVFPRSGFEVYGEFGREDSNYDKRDLALELTHNAGYMFGLRKAWSRSATRLFSARAEFLNTRPGITTLAHEIPQYPFYLHGAATQGHTQRGQILASPAGFGGAGELVALDYYHSRGLWSLQWNRVELGERDRNWTDLELEGKRVLDVMQSLGLNTTFFTDHFDITAGVTGAYELNRDFKEDVFNLNASVGLRARI